ncbi:hypothetical protein DFH29DRAFT_838892 [Suillus ampliporus]|nr:hypothetical protein DFH29DRAFT_838892 [Suillus ampliporus]
MQRISCVSIIKTTTFRCKLQVPLSLLNLQRQTRKPYLDHPRKSISQLDTKNAQRTQGMSSRSTIGCLLRILMLVTPSNGGQAAAHNFRTSRVWLVISSLFLALPSLLSAFFQAVVILFPFDVLVSNPTRLEH